MDRGRPKVGSGSSSGTGPFGDPRALVRHLGLLSSCSCSSSWEMTVPIASGQGHSPQVKGCIQSQPLALGESSSPGSINWVSTGSPTLGIQITASFYR